MFPYTNRVGVAKLNIHATEAAFKFSYKYKSKLPTEALYYVTRVFGSKKFKADVVELRQAVNQVADVNEQFKYFLLNDWVFDSSSKNKLAQFVSTACSPEE